MTAYLESYSTSSTGGTVWYHWNIVYTDSCMATTTAPTNGNIIRQTTTYSATNYPMMSATTSSLSWDWWNANYVVRQQSTTSSSTCPVTDCWPAWTAERVTPQQILTPVRVSEEERARRLAEEARWKKQAEEAEAKRKEAEARAERLLEMVLNAQQREEYKTKGCFHLYTNGKKYRVKKGWAGNVELLDVADQPVAKYCIHPIQKIPDADNLVAQKLLLEANEEQFRRVANETRYRR